jgi:hypothetical protein
MPLPNYQIGAFVHNQAYAFRQVSAGDFKIHVQVADYLASGWRAPERKRSATSAVLAVMDHRHSRLTQFLRDLICNRTRPVGARVIYEDESRKGT